MSELNSLQERASITKRNVLFPAVEVRSRLSRRVRFLFRFRSFPDTGEYRPRNENGDRALEPRNRGERCVA